MGYKKWVFPNVDKQLVSELADDCGLDPLVVFIACARGMFDPYEIEQFVSKEPELSDPYDYSGIREAVERINIAIESNEKVLVFGDYDCDGVTATAILVRYLKSRGLDVSYKIPHRLDDGYGISCDAIKEAADEGVTLIITVDNGINAIKEAEFAVSLGVDLVITDHHIPLGELPNAVAVIDPHIDEGDDYLFCDLCGAGVAFKLVCALDDRPAEEMIYEYADLVALGTIADVVPMIRENREIVALGLELINRRRNNGIKALMQASGAKFASSGSVGFTLSPRINAAGRMATADIAVKLLLAESFEDAEYYASVLDRLNTERQETEQKIFEEAIKEIEDKQFYNDRVIVVSKPGWHKGVIGIVAAKIAERYSKPTIVISEDGDLSCGSGRSISGFSLFDAISSCAHLLKKFGGHELAAGVTLSCDDIDEFRAEINKFSDKKDIRFAELNIDCRIKPRAFTVDAVKALKVFEPYGANNPVPLFAVTECKILDINLLSNGKHIRLKLRKEESTFFAVMFAVSKEDFSYSVGDTVDVAVTLDINTYNNTESVSVIVKSLRKSFVDYDSFEKDVLAVSSLQNGVLCSSDALNILPNRDDIAVVFRYIKSNSGKSAEFVENALLSSLNIGKIKVALYALMELGIISFSEGKYYINEYSGKVDLQSAPILKKINSLVKEGELC